MATAIRTPGTRPVLARRLPTRLILIGAGIGAILLSLLAIGAATNAYSTTLTLFKQIVEVNAAKVNASEAALANIAAIDSQAADFVATASDNPKHWASLDGVHASFQGFRDEMFKVRANLTSPEEEAAYQRVEYFSFDQFWQSIGNLLTAQTNGDKETAVRAYIIADNYLQNQIARYLLELERLNFESMVRTGQDARGTISAVTIGMALFVIALGVVLTLFSFWVRRRIKRYLTPGLDIAMVVGWLLAILMLLDLSQTPGKLDRMIKDSYQSVTASARVLAGANQAASMESGSIIDPVNAAFWNRNFDNYRRIVELRLCGMANCSQTTFVTAAGSDRVVTSVASAAKAANKVEIDNIVPLVGNVTFAGEANALEEARIALQDFIRINASVRDLVTKNQIDDAVLLSTGVTKGQSDEAFARFSKAINDLRAINVKVFDDTWQDVQGTLNRGTLLFAVLGYVLVIVGIIAGVLQREREFR